MAVERGLTSWPASSRASSLATCCAFAARQPDGRTLSAAAHAVEKRLRSGRSTQSDDRRMRVPVEVVRLPRRIECQACRRQARAATHKANPAAISVAVQSAVADWRGTGRSKPRRASCRRASCADGIGCTSRSASPSHDARSRASWERQPVAALP